MFHLGVYSETLLNYVSIAHAFLHKRYNVEVCVMMHKVEGMGLMQAAGLSITAQRHGRTMKGTTTRSGCTA